MMQTYLPETIKSAFTVFAASMIPVLESKGAIILGAKLKLRWYLCWIVSSTGSGMVAPFVLYMKAGKSKITGYLAEKLRKTHPDVIAKLKKYGAPGLMFLIAVPFTGIGVWLGSFAARILRLEKRKAVIAIFAGNLIANLLMVLCVYGIITGIRMWNFYVKF